MKTKNTLRALSIAVVMHFGVLAGSAQINIYLFSGSETNTTLPSGTYIITAYGAPGGHGINGGGDFVGGGGTGMSGEFNFSTSTNLTLLVGGGGGVVSRSVVSGGGGGGFLGNGGGPGGGLSFENGGNGGDGSGGFGGGGSDYGGGGGGSIIDSSATAILAEVSGIASPDDSTNGEIIIIALPPPLAITADGANVVLTWPAADTGFTANGYRVESATNLVPPVAWQTNSTAPIVIGGQDVIIIPMSGSQHFFRLH